MEAHASLMLTIIGLLFAFGVGLLMISHGISCVQKRYVRLHGTLDTSALVPWRILRKSPWDALQSLHHLNGSSTYTSSVVVASPCVRLGPLPLTLRRPSKPTSSAFSPSMRVPPSHWLTVSLHSPDLESCDCNDAIGQSNRSCPPSANGSRASGLPFSLDERSNSHAWPALVCLPSSIIEADSVLPAPQYSARPSAQRPSQGYSAATPPPTEWKRVGIVAAHARCFPGKPTEAWCPEDDSAAQLVNSEPRAFTVSSKHRDGRMLSPNAPSVDDGVRPFIASPMTTPPTTGPTPHHRETSAMAEDVSLCIHKLRRELSAVRMCAQLGFRQQQQRR
mmetsp:Transcript_5462/g.12576  ORF Transcript_5462/g.12576 Transcript_5462/m.12576 type:complete len:334 (-) Transcript_5462:673-1674(-)